MIWLILNLFSLSTNVNAMRSCDQLYPRSPTPAVSYSKEFKIEFDPARPSELKISQTSTPSEALLPAVFNVDFADFLLDPMNAELNLRTYWRYLTSKLRLKSEGTHIQGYTIDQTANLMLVKLPNAYFLFNFTTHAWVNVLATTDVQAKIVGNLPIRNSSEDGPVLSIFVIKKTNLDKTIYIYGGIDSEDQRHLDKINHDHSYLIVDEKGRMTLESNIRNLSYYYQQQLREMFPRLD